MNIRQLYDQLWIKEALIESDERKALYFERTVSIPALVIDNIMHIACVFPGLDGDYQRNVQAMIIEQGV